MWCCESDGILLLGRAGGIHPAHADQHRLCPLSTGGKTEPAAVTRWVELVEQGSRMAYLLAVVLLVSRQPLALRSVWLYLAGGFLALYYAVWLRYFAGGRKTELLRRAFLLVPLPLAVFPVLYYLCAAIWLHNVPAVITMIIFGAAHITVSLQSFRKEENR